MVDVVGGKTAHDTRIFMYEVNFACKYFAREHQSRGVGYSLVAWLTHLAIDHASLLRRSTVPAPNRGTGNIWTLIRFFHTLHRILLILTLSCFAVCGHHLSPRITIVSSPLCMNRLPNVSTSHSSVFLISFSDTSRSSSYVSHSLTM